VDDTVDPDIPAELLGDLEDSARAERAELIEWLMRHGFTVEQIRGAVAPMLLPAGRLMGDDGTYMSAREISETYGIDLDLLQRMQRALGLPTVDDPDRAVYLRADADAAVSGQRFIDIGLDAEQVITVARVLSEGLSHAAEVMRYSALAAVLQPGLTELQVAQASEAIVRQIAPLLGPMIQDMLFVQLRHQMETEAVNAGERAAGTALPGARQITVAVAARVGISRLGEEVPAEELGQLANRLADLARDVAVPPVRFVKTIGDAVMFVCPDPAPLLDVVIKLVEITDGDNDFPRLRAGVASGSAVSRAGDWFGSPVNLASRVTAVARPGAVLAAESTRDELGDEAGFSWSYAGARHLKGIKGEVKLFRGRRGDGPST
jgi:adenylate cyclase